MSGIAVWGFEIESTPSGRKIWPNDLKYEATRRIREDGASPGSIAAEIGAHECLVRKWWVGATRQYKRNMQCIEHRYTGGSCNCLLSFSENQTAF